MRGYSRRYLGLAGLILLALPSVAAADGLVPRASAVVTDATVSVIDPETGVSVGGGASDLRLAVGDVVTVRWPVSGLLDGSLHAVQSYLTTYIPENTEVVGLRLLDASGETVRPRHPGVAVDGCTGGAACNTVPAGQQSGSVAQLYADSGIFYSTDPRTAANPSGQPPTLNNGIELDPQPADASWILGLLDDSPPAFAHNSWDETQAETYGTDPGNTPHLYGSPVAGPNTHYRYEAGGANAIGPWQRVSYQGSLIGTGVGDIGSSSNVTRVSIPYAGGVKVTPNDPLSATTVRFAAGEERATEPLIAEVALRVTDVPLDPQIGNTVCSEAFGHELSAKSANSAPGHPWVGFVPTPACASLGLKLDVQPDRALAMPGDSVGYVVSGRNLSLNAQTNSSVLVNFKAPLIVSSLDGGTQVDCPAGFTGTCIRWTLGTLEPSQTFQVSPTFSVQAGYFNAVVRGLFTSDQMPTGHETASVITTTAVPSLHAEMTSVSPSTSPGGIANVSLELSNEGTGDLTTESLQFNLPAGYRIQFGQITYAGTTFNCTGTGCGSASSQTFNVADTILPGDTVAVTLNVQVPVGASSPALNEMSLAAWSNASFFGRFETFFPQVATIPVGAVRSEPPTIVCPSANATSIAGSTSEADGTVVTTLMNLSGSSSTVSSGGAWEAADVAATYGTLYPGLEIRAIAQAPGELPSAPSSACVVEAAVPPPPPSYPVAVSMTGTGTGSVSSSPGGIDCPIDCDEFYPEGTVVELTATPGPESGFDGWSGSCSGVGTCQLTTDQIHEVTATFVFLERRPDGHVKYSKDASFIGNDIYNGTAQSQTRIVRGRRRISKSFLVRVENDGTTTDDFTIRGRTSGKGFTVKYFSGTTDVTPTVGNGSFTVQSLSPGARRSIRVEIRIGRRARVGSTKAVLVIVRSVGDLSTLDGVKAGVRVVR